MRAWASCRYEAQVATIAIHGSPFRGVIVEEKPGVQVINAYVKQNYKIDENHNDNDQATTDSAFWDGAGDYHVSAAKNDGQSFFSQQLYKWEVTGDGTPFIPQPHIQQLDSNFLPSEQPEAITSKEFHLDFGNGNDGFPKTSVIQCIISDGDDTQEIPTHVTVHWYQPRWFVTTATPVTTVTGSKDPDKANGPIDPSTVHPDDPDFVEMQTINLYIQERKDFVHQGATMVAAALQAEQSVAEFYATGPLAEMGVGALASGISSCTDALKGAAEARRTLELAGQFATEADRLAAEGGGLGKSKEEADALREMAEEFRTGQEVQNAKSAVDKSADAERIFKEACEAKAAKDPHYNELGLDANGQFRPREAETGTRLEGAAGGQATRSADPAYDWIINGRKYDAVSNVPPEFFDQQWSSIQQQIVDHVNKQGLDFTVFDKTFYAGYQRLEIDNFIATLTEAQRAKIIVLG